MRAAGEREGVEGVELEAEEVVAAAVEVVEAAMAVRVALRWVWTAGTWGVETSAMASRCPLQCCSTR